MDSKGAKLFCNACGKTWEMDEYGQMHALDGKTEFRGEIQYIETEGIADNRGTFEKIMGGIGEVHKHKGVIIVFIIKRSKKGILCGGYGLDALVGRQSVFNHREAFVFAVSVAKYAHRSLPIIV